MPGSRKVIMVLHFLACFYRLHLWWVIMRVILMGQVSLNAQSELDQTWKTRFKGQESRQDP